MRSRLDPDQTMETRCGHTDVALIQINVGRPGGSTEAVQRRTCAKSRRELKEKCSQYGLLASHWDG
jgi:hypothetical protein